MELTLANCGCQLPSFTCVTCKKKCVVYSPKPTPTGKPYTMTYLPTVPTGYQISLSYQYPVYLSIIYRYCNEKYCASDAKITERSAECPKAVFVNQRYICGLCRVGSINTLNVCNDIHPALQALLELTLEE